jgi:uncharacterized protein
MRFKLAMVIFGIGFLQACHSQAASFACEKAATPIEKAICADAKLSELDEHLARYYGLALQALGDGAVCVKQDQRAWVKATQKSCAAKTACLTKSYLKRLAVLDGLQPGASAVKNIELPFEPSLVAALPPENNETTPSGKPVAYSGHVIHESTDQDNMGYAIKSADGKSHVFVLDMNIGDSIAHQAVADLIANESSTQFIVRGTNADGGFDEQKCRMIYRVK